MTERTELPVWQQLKQHAAQMQTHHMKQLFAENSQRFAQFSLKTPEFLFDYSKNLITQETMSLLMQLARDVELEKWRERMFAGEHINFTEDRAVLHVALRDTSTSLEVDGQLTNVQVSAALQQMQRFVSQVRQGEWRGYSGQAITDVVSIGIGGSNLGPQMVTEALKHYADDRLRVHYVSNVDGVQIAEVLKPLDPQTTLFVVSSKTFTTSETMTNAKTAMQWLVEAAGDPAAIAKHCVAVSANVAKAKAFGIDEQNIFTMWDWVGGRYSLWSTIGLPIALYLGFEQFMDLLDGAYEMDEQFKTASLEQNAPVILALLNVWNCTFLGMPTHAILPYDQTLGMLPAYLQQAEMESNGKSVNWQGETVDYPTVPVIWGELGINGQHAFYQFLHQSNQVVPADFIGSVKPVIDVEGHHDILMANFFAQTQALMSGVDLAQVQTEMRAKGADDSYIEAIAPHKVHQGNRPTNTILMQCLTPKSLGSLIALYEQKIFVQGILLQICSFDQWGVELGKGLAANIHQNITSDVQRDGEQNSHDSSTSGLLEHYKQIKMSRGS